MTEFASLSLTQDPVSVGRAREFVSAVACGAHCAEQVVLDAVLLTSEVVTNAALHGGPPIELSVECTGEGLVVTVRDGSPTLPVVRVASLADVGGRGMMLLEAVANAWGVETQGQAGKTIWFRLAA